MLQITSYLPSFFKHNSELETLLLDSEIQIKDEILILRAKSGYKAQLLMKNAEAVMSRLQRLISENPEIYLSEIHFYSNKVKVGECSITLFNKARFNKTYDSSSR